MYKPFIDFVRELYGTDKPIPLHAPTFEQRDRDYVLDAIDSTFVSSVGEYVNRFEKDLAAFAGAARAVATVNGTTAIQVALRLVGVGPADEVITQPLTFVATANAISHLGAVPVFVDVDKDTMGMSPAALEAFLSEHAERKDSGAYNRLTGRRIAAILPMHTYGHPCRIQEIIQTADAWAIPVVEDAAEAIGSTINGKHCGLFGRLGILSFNGNKTITCGGGGAILTNDEQMADHAKHLTTTAKIPHPWEFDHDEIAYNFRLPNLNAALACAQLERLPEIIVEKRAIAGAYKAFFESHVWARFMTEPDNTQSNYWLCTIALSDRAARDALLEATNTAGVMTRPAWKLMPDLAMYAACAGGPLDNSRWLQDRIVNLPSSVRS
ncbi:MAG TPA: aminotransferase DegT [Candidatus Atribacteria bacterium]|nr:aminotransferase DegT [Candidatus Atribacteria bacterium]